MRSFDEDVFSFWGMACLLAFAPLVQGGCQVWAALLLAAGVGVIWVLRGLRAVQKGSLLLVGTPSDFFLIAGLLWVLASLSRPHSPPGAFDSFLILTGCAGCFFLARRLALSGRAVRLVFVLSGMAALVSLINLFQLFDLLPHGWWKSGKFPASTFMNHSHFAAYLEVVFPLSALLWFAPSLRPPHRFFLAVSTVLMASGLVLSYSRGAWVSLAVSAALGTAWIGFRRLVPAWNWRRGLVVAGAFLAVGFTASQPAVFSRAASLLDLAQDSSFQLRREIWLGTWNLLKEAPLLGHGAGSFIFEFTRHRPAGVYWFVNYAHNEYLQLIVEFGLVGLAIALLTAGAVFGRGARLVQGSRTPWKRALGFGGLVGLGSLAFHSLGDFPWHIPAVAYQAAAAAGLLTGIAYQSNPSPLRMTRVALQGSWPRQFLRFAFFGFLAAASVAFWPLGTVIAADLRAFQGDWEAAARLAPYRTSYHEKLAEGRVRTARRRGGSERYGAWKDAVKAYQDSLTLVPQNARSAHALGLVFRELGRLREAAHWLDQARKNDPQNPLYWRDWAQIQLFAGKALEAAAGFREAERLKRPRRLSRSLWRKLDHPAAFVRQGGAELALGRPAAAQNYFKVALALQTDNPEAQAGLVVSALRTGNLEGVEERLDSLHDPALKARAYAVLAEEELHRNRPEAARRALGQSLSYDASNLLARRLKEIVETRGGKMFEENGPEGRLLALNRSPVFVQKKGEGRWTMIWEPEMGVYEKGEKIYEGWALYGKGTIAQRMILPAGRARFQVIARGSKAKGRGPTLRLRWEGRTILKREVLAEKWSSYETETEIRPGESLLRITFPNDARDREAGEDRNLKIDKVIVTWEGRS